MRRCNPTYFRIVKHNPAIKGRVGSQKNSLLLTMFEHAVLNIRMVVQVVRHLVGDDRGTGERLRFFAFGEGRSCLHQYF